MKVQSHTFLCNRSGPFEDVDNLCQACWDDYFKRTEVLVWPSSGCMTYDLVLSLNLQVIIGRFFGNPLMPAGDELRRRNRPVSHTFSKSDDLASIVKWLSQCCVF